MMMKRRGGSEDHDHIHDDNYQLLFSHSQLEQKGKWRREEGEDEESGMKIVRRRRDDHLTHHPHPHHHRDDWILKC